ncbi:MAG: PAS domain-containing sensor histidine kinase [Prolixibacteraceae bacterium]|jgi:two-component system sensor histidine kinase/response regulator|nr:PAS domain-containing sensor histidine kinase [Prolixibacteraceae bacterium]
MGTIVNTAYAFECIIDAAKYLNFNSITSISGLININSDTGVISVDRMTLIVFILLLVVLFIVFSFLLRGKRQRHILNEKNMMSSLIDNVPDTIYFKDLESKFTRINKAQSDLLGLKHPDEAIGKSDFDYFKYAQAAYDVEQEIIRTRKPIINDVHVHEINGKKLFLSDTKVPLIDSDGKCNGTVGITRDITDLKLTQNLMLENQAKFKALFENAPLAIFRLDKSMKVVEFNHRYRKMFGYTTSDDMSNISNFDMLADAELGELILDTLMETKEVNTEIMLKRKNGDKFIANLTLALLDEGYDELSIEGIVEDITKVAKARDELIKAKDKAVEADKLKSLFLANMSHEIRTPMNAIIGFTNMLREDDLSFEDRNSFIDVVQNNGNSLMTLIDSIVDFSKLEADQMKVSLGEFNFKNLFDSTCEYAENLIKAEEKLNIKVIRTIPEDPEIRITSDRHRLNQVLNHLVSNAVKFTDEGEIEIGYKLENGKFIIFIRDTGIGISSKKYKAIFERFAKVNNDKNRLYGGTGIGLTISKGLIKLMKGKIEVNSVVGEGSTFTIEL